MIRLENGNGGAALQRNRRYLCTLIATVTVYLSLMIVFTPTDYGITDALYHPGTPFGKACEVAGPAFMPLFVIWSATGLLTHLRFRGKVRSFFACLGIVFTLLYALFMGSMTLKHSYLPALFVPGIVLYVLLIALSVRLNRRIGEKGAEYVGLHVRICLVIFIVAAASLLGADAIKSVFGRIRYINLTSPDGFYPWYRINKFDFNSSFPSGHASRSMVTVCFALLPLYGGKRPKLSATLFVCGFLFSLTVGFSRLMEGMHYPSDVLTGMTLSLLSFEISSHRLLREPNG